MAEPDGIRERIGLDYLLGEREPVETKRDAQEEPRDPKVKRAQSLGVVEASVRAFAPKRILQVVRELDVKSGGKGARLEQVADVAQMADDTLLPLARQLEDAGLLEVLERKWANDLVKLGPKGAEVLEKSDDSELVEILNLA